MKYIMVLFVLTLSTAFAEQPDFTVNITNDGYVVLDIDDWDITSVEANYDFYISKNNKDLGKGYHRVYSWTEFKEPEYYSYLQGSVQRMISYGFMNCNEGTFSLMGSLYVDQKNKILDSTGYEYGEYLVEVTTPNTSRNKAFIKVCQLGQNI